MAKLIKWLLIVLLGLVGLLAIALAAVWLLVDPNDYRDDISRLVEENTGQELVIEGDIGLSLFPWLGLDLGRTRLENREGFGEQPFVQVERIGVAVRLLPLVRRELVLDTVRLEGLLVHLVRNEQGEGNWELDLPDDREEPPPEAPEPPPETEAPDPEDLPVAIGRLEGVELTDFRLIYEDLQAGTRQEVGPVNVSVGQIDLDRDVPLRADWVAQIDDDLRIEGELDSVVRVAPGFDVFHLDLRELQVRTFADGLPEDGLPATLRAVVDADLNEDTARLDSFRLQAAGLDLSASADVRSLTSEPAADGAFELAQTDLRAVLEALGQEVDNDVPYPSDVTFAGSFSFADDTLSVPDFRLRGSGLDLTTEVLVSQLTAEPRAEGRFDLAETDVRAVLLALDQEVEEDGPYPTDLTFGGSFNFVDDALAVEGMRLQAAGLDLGAEIRVSDLTGDLRAEGRFDLAETDVRAVLLALGQEVEDNGPYPTDLRLGGSFTFADDALGLADFRLQAAGLDLTAQAQVAGLADEPLIDGRFDLAEVNLREVLQTLNQEVPDTADPDVLTAFSLGGVFNVAGDSATIGDLAIRLDDTSMDGSVSVREFEDPMIGFDIQVDRLDADRYLPTPAEDAPAPVEASGEDEEAEPVELPLELLRALRLDGSFRMGELVINELVFNDLTFTVQADEGELRVHPVGARLYGGEYQGDIRIDARGEQAVIRVNERVEGVQARSLVEHFMGKDLLEGVGNLAIEAEAEGVEVMDLVRTLVGQAEFSFADGAVMGVNIPQMIRGTTARIKGQPVEASAEPARTDFAELAGRVTFDRGIVRNEELNAQSPLLRVAGGGEANLLEQTVDYRLTVNLVGTLRGQGGESLDELQRIPIPLRIRGSLLQPAISLDLQAALSEQQLQRLRDEAEDLRRQAREAEAEARERVERERQQLEERARQERAEAEERARQEREEAEERLRRERERAEQRLREEREEREGEARDRAREELRRLIR